MIKVTIRTYLVRTYPEEVIPIPHIVRTYHVASDFTIGSGSGSGLMRKITCSLVVSSVILLILSSLVVRYTPSTRTMAIAVIAHTFEWEHLRTCVNNVVKASKVPWPLYSNNGRSISRSCWKDDSEKVSESDKEMFIVDLFLATNAGADKVDAVAAIQKSLAGYVRVHVVRSDVNVSVIVEAFRLMKSLGLQYDFVLNLVGGKNDNIMEELRHHSLECLCGTPAQVQSVIHAVSNDENSKTHIVAPHGLSITPFTPIENVYHTVGRRYFVEGKNTAFSMDLEADLSDFKHLLSASDKYPFLLAGGLYWARFDAFDPLLQVGALSEKQEDVFLQRVVPSLVQMQWGQPSIVEIIPAPKLVATYFPQYHAIPENDKFWGKGFTEWTLLRPHNGSGLRKPLPVSQGGLGYYNLLNVSTRIGQAELVVNSGVHALMFYHYWFSGAKAPQGHKVMYRVTEARLKDGEPNVPFMLSWANEVGREYIRIKTIIVPYSSSLCMM